MFLSTLCKSFGYKSQNVLQPKNCLFQQFTPTYSNLLPLYADYLFLKWSCFYCFISDLNDCKPKLPRKNLFDPPWPWNTADCKIKICMKACLKYVRNQSQMQKLHFFCFFSLKMSYLNQKLFSLILRRCKVILKSAFHW